MPSSTSNTMSSEMTYRGAKASVLNTAMKIYIPETKFNLYSDYPMMNERWYKPDEYVPYGSMKGQPCYIKTEWSMPESTGTKDGYIWGPGDFGWGYYHLTTKSAYKILYTRILNNKVTISGESEGFCSCCFQTPDPRTVMPKPTSGTGSGLTKDDIDNLRVLFHARSVSTKGNDGVAQSDQLQIANNYRINENNLGVVTKFNHGVKQNIIKR